MGKGDKVRAAEGAEDDGGPPLDGIGGVLEHALHDARSDAHGVVADDIKSHDGDAFRLAPPPVDAPYWVGVAHLGPAGQESGRRGRHRGSSITHVPLSLIRCGRTAWKGGSRRLGR